MKGKCRFYTIEKAALEYEAQLGAPCDCGPRCPKGNRSGWHSLHAWFSFGCQPRSAHSIPCETRMRPCRQAHQPHVPLRRAVANCATLPASAGRLFCCRREEQAGAARARQEGHGPGLPALRARQAAHHFQRLARAVCAQLRDSHPAMRRAWRRPPAGVRCSQAQRSRTARYRRPRSCCLQAL